MRELTSASGSNKKDNSREVIPDLKLIIKGDNAPAINEVAIILAGEEHSERDIVLKKRDNRLSSNKETHTLYYFLQYPLMFPHRKDDYNFFLRHVDPVTGQENNKSVFCKSNGPRL